MISVGLIALAKDVRIGATITFAIPWILLQMIELIVPNAGETLSRSKSIRELLPSEGLEE